MCESCFSSTLAAVWHCFTWKNLLAPFKQHTHENALRSTCNNISSTNDREMVECSCEVFQWDHWLHCEVKAFYRSNVKTCLKESWCSLKKTSSNMVFCGSSYTLRLWPTAHCTNQMLHPASPDSHTRPDSFISHWGINKWSLRTVHINLHTEEINRMLIVGAFQCANLGFLSSPLLPWPNNCFLLRHHGGFSNLLILPVSSSHLSLTSSLRWEETHVKEVRKHISIKNKTNGVFSTNQQDVAFSHFPNQSEPQPVRIKWVQYICGNLYLLWTPVGAHDVITMHNVTI